MEFDLKKLLDAWPYDSEDPSKNIRCIEGEDGRTLIQVREPLGIQQLDYDGRPDGIRPHGRSTWLEWYEEQAENDPDFTMTHEDTLRLMQEGVLIYQRYLILFQLEDWRGVARDTARNIRYFDFTKAHAAHPEDPLAIEQYRPYLMRMNSIARSHILWNAAEYDSAIALLTETMESIRTLDTIDTQIFKTECERAVEHLAQSIEEFVGKRPLSQLDALKQRQKEAVRQEDFELAARLRDEIQARKGEFVSKN